jgi:hypothetical protein
VLLAFLTICSIKLQAQVKISNNASVANPDAMLEIESINKGLLLPRLALESTTSPAPLGNFVKGMVVFDTATVNDITPGIYYSDGTKWIKTNGGQTSVATGMSVQKKLEMVATPGQTVFTTPFSISDANKIFLYRNGVMISFNVAGINSIVAEVASVENDEIRIVQIL